MAPHLDTSNFSDFMQQGPNANKFFGLLTRIYSKITVFKEGEHEDHGQAEVVRLIADRVNQMQKPEDREAFFQRAHDVFTAFFGIEYLSPDEIMPQIIALVRKVHGDVAQHVDFENTSSLRSLQDRVGNAQSLIVHQARSRSFNVGSFLDTLFDGQQSISRERLQEHIALCSDLPVRAREALEKFASVFRGPNIVRQNLKGTLNATLSKEVLTPEEDVVIQKLSSLNAFLESLKAPPDVVDFFAHLYLRGSMSFEDAKNLLDHQPSTLPAEILYSAFNGKVLLDDPFVQLRSREALAQALINSMYAGDFIQIVTLLTDVASKHTPIDHLCLRTGIGGTPDPMPVRLASYVLCSLSIARRFQERFGASPKIEFFTGQEGAIACNSVDPDVVRANTADAFTFVDAFSKQFFPDVSHAFSLVEDHPWESNPRIVVMIDYLEQILRNAVSQDPVLSTMVGQLESRARNHDGRDGNSALRYAAFHVLCFRDIPTLNRYIEGPNFERPMHVISVGGAAEREFDYIRALLAEKFSVQDFNQFVASRDQDEFAITTEDPPLHTRASIITGTGILPPYYSADPEGDVRINQLTLPDNDSRIFVSDRVHHALSMSRPGQDSSAIGRARSVVRGMILVASAAPPEKLYPFVTQYNGRADAPSRDIPPVSHSTPQNNL